MARFVYLTTAVFLLQCILAVGYSEQVTTGTGGLVLSEDGVTTPVRLSPEERAMAFLEKLEVKYREVTTIQGEFQQLKKNVYFREEIKSQGVFYFKKPGKFRCDYLPPNESIYILANDTAWLYVPEIKQVDKVYMGQRTSRVERLNHMLLGFGVSVQDVREVYAVETVDSGDEKNSVAIKFTLLKPNPDVNFESITIWFDNESLAAKKVYIDEIGEDETIIDLKEIKVNTNISEALFRPFFPKDVEIIEHY